MGVGSSRTTMMLNAGFSAGTKPAKLDM